MSTEHPTAREMADALARGHYFRVDLDSGVVAWWPTCNRYPQIMSNKPIERRAMLRTATGLRQPVASYSEAVWLEIVAMLPDVTGGQP
jgi:hypothetical protein